MNLPTLILHYESLKNKICQPNPLVRADLQVMVRSKLATPWTQTVKMPLSVEINPLNDIVHKDGREKYAFCEQLEQLMHEALDAVGACAEQHEHVDVFYDVDFDGCFQVA